MTPNTSTPASGVQIIVDFGRFQIDLFVTLLHRIDSIWVIYYVKTFMEVVCSGIISRMRHSGSYIYLVYEYV